MAVSKDHPMLLKVSRKNGLNYTMEHDKFVVQFLYRLDISPKPGALLPELPSEQIIRPFSSLLTEAIDEFCTIYDQLSSSESRGVKRLGIVATCRLDENLLPPGVKMFSEYLSRPWGTHLSKCNVHLLATISESEKIRDRCHHQLDMDDDKKGEVGFILDWQRIFTTEVEMGKGKLIREQIKKGSDAALEYFERFGRGDLRYGLDQ